MKQNTDPAATIDSLRSAGADQFDPVRFHFLEVLARRVLEHDGEVRHILEEKLMEAQSAYQERLERTIQSGRNQLVTRQTSDKHNTHRTLLSTLAHDIEQHAALPSATPADDGLVENTNINELKSIRSFRKTWSKLSVDKQVSQAFERIPKNAGPLNSHLLVLRSFALMRDISPDYLSRFMSYIDTLLWLDHAAQSVKPVTRKPRLRRKQ